MMTTTMENGGPSNLAGSGNEEGDEYDGGDFMEIDLETIMQVLNEDTNPSTPEDLSFNNLSKSGSTPDVSQYENSLPQIGYQVLDCTLPLGADSKDYATLNLPYNSESLDARSAGLGGSLDSLEDAGVVFDHQMLESSAPRGSPVHTYHVEGNYLAFTGNHETEMFRVSQFEVPSCSAASNFSIGDAKHVSAHADNIDINISDAGTGFQFSHAVGAVPSKYAAQSPVMWDFDGNFRCYDASAENSLGTLGGPETESDKPNEIPFTDADMSPHTMTSADSTLCHRSDFASEFNDHHLSMQYYMNTDDLALSDYTQHCLLHSSSLQAFPSTERSVTKTKEESGEFPTESAYSTSKIWSAPEGSTSTSVSEISKVDYWAVNSQNFKSEDSNYVSPFCQNSSFDTDGRLIDDNVCVMTRPVFGVKNEKYDEIVASSSTMCHSVPMIDETIGKNISYGIKDLKQPFPGTSPFISSQELMACPKFEKEDMIVQSSRGLVGEIAVTSPIGGAGFDLNAMEQYFPCPQPFTSDDWSSGCIKNDTKGKLIQPKCLNPHLSKVSPESIQSNSSDNKSQVDNDPDICILEDISQPAKTIFSQVLVKTATTLPPSTYGDSPNYNGDMSTRLKTNDERLVFRVALQYLSQPKCEASPPDGVLAVPLLRHQRIALSWMVQKETSSLHCSGGILADDQGLGKTISTIALILKERPPSCKPQSVAIKKEELETLNLDDDDEVRELDGMKPNAYHSKVLSSYTEMNKLNCLGQAKGRPTAGTLVVCPTSVLRQWAEELHNKVTGEAKLSVLVYYGSNRTKDPYELAKYDVVLTTYSIVSMEVPKQPLVDGDDDEKRKAEGNGVTLMGFSSGKKRKYPPGAGKKCSKHKKGLDSSLLESVVRPLAKVGWFRVVLDEAQSIKNHRTQVARACWGLRAKRRWCLSGTPIQNSIDDLYSYFRFLRYEPYAVYKSFLSTLKIPISKNPAKGYRKLQAVLKTVMLRRTKGTLLDGEPIINLPPRLVELKKVDFTLEERDFYSRLESDSRAQFKEYADAGTVKQNYVNILLMLLRLRQACDHPFLVRGVDSSSMWTSSIEIAKKLPRDKQIYLLSCLEASLAICHICNDPPEDSVVSVCGHVFCNQCICEHLTGEDNHCPAINCKVQLRVASVFSKTILNSCISNQPGQDQSSDGSGPEPVDALECSERSPYDSSKIKAALEILQSLAKPIDKASTKDFLQSSSNKDTDCPENTYDTGVTPNPSPDNSVRAVGGKAIVFSQWTRMLDLLETCLSNSSIQYRRLDGTMSVVARDKAVKDFNTLPEVTVMIMSLKAASLGLNMVAACNVVLLDLWWNPTTEDQAIDRAHRIGQTRPVKVLRLTVKDTVEDRILALQQKKREMVASAFGEDETGSRQTRLTEEDLQYLFMG
ncbi:helicase-like transcription factor CHR28 isoform X2 [Tripterygium wilfordii]|uniref:helicase-like transcription factor CHR28 isoform X2 n=1 Tax=Tripterygium wilfordii TaxID=458696 RepID=UPI0018F832C3|nr:helicase-like transcription factor CHR28 isoform X2 [Tripterygium wilfordii]